MSPLEKGALVSPPFEKGGLGGISPTAIKYNRRYHPRFRQPHSTHRGRWWEDSDDAPVGQVAVVALAGQRGTPASTCCARKKSYN